MPGRRALCVPDPTPVVIRAWRGRLSAPWSISRSCRSPRCSPTSSATCSIRSNSQSTISTWPTGRGPVGMGGIAWGIGVAILLLGGWWLATGHAEIDPWPRHPGRGGDRDAAPPLSVPGDRRFRPVRCVIDRGRARPHPTGRRAHRPAPGPETTVSRRWRAPSHWPARAAVLGGIVFSGIDPNNGTCCGGSRRPA